MRIQILVGAALLAVVSGEAAAQPAAPIHGRAVAAEIQKLLDANYVLPGTRPKFDAMLDQGPSQAAVTTFPIPTSWPSGSTAISTRSRPTSIFT